MAQQQQEHPIFRDIDRGDLEAVQQRVPTDAAVLEERGSIGRGTPLMCAIENKEPAIALWLIEHRGQHDLDTADSAGRTALHWASLLGPLEVVQALVAAGANPAARDGRGDTPFIWASDYGHTDIVAFLLQLPAVKATIDYTNADRYTALSWASRGGCEPIVQILLDAGANPTIPAGQDSPLPQALSHDHQAIAALLRQPIVMAERVLETVLAVDKDDELRVELLFEIAKYVLPAWATKRLDA